MKLTQTQLIQLISIVLILIAGYLWSHRLANEKFVEYRNNIRDGSSEQIQTLRQRVLAKNDPYELVNFGKNFLAAGNPEFAITALERATELAPKFRDGWYLLGYAELQMANETSGKDHTEHLASAKAALRKAFAIDPRHEPTNDLLNQLGGK